MMALLHNIALAAFLLVFVMVIVAIALFILPFVLIAAAWEFISGKVWPTIAETVRGAAWRSKR